MILPEHRQSLVQATKSARNSKIRYYVGLLIAILLFGGFLVRSYYEEYAFKRDVKRLLAYYQHIVPGSIADGDEQNARYLVWKYRYKKQKLWRMLEKKYGEVVLQANEWPEDTKSTDQQEVEEEINLDEDDKKDDSAGDAKDDL